MDRGPAAAAVPVEAVQAATNHRLTRDRHVSLTEPGSGRCITTQEKEGRGNSLLPFFPRGRDFRRHTSLYKIHILYSLRRFRGKHTEYASC